MTPVINKALPEFEALATSGVKFTPQSNIGKAVVLYFYPKDNTPGCTTEAMQFRDQHKDFLKAGAVVFGVSRDNMASHEKFKANLELPFELIADTEEKLCHMFGVVKNKIMYGKKVKGIERSTFLIGPDGILKQEWRGLKVPGHVEDVLKAVKALKKASSAAAKEAATVKETTAKDPCAWPVEFSNQPQTLPERGPRLQAAI
jgi:peroxiredoxin Q/BCP